MGPAAMNARILAKTTWSMCQSNVEPSLKRAHKLNVVVNLLIVKHVSNKSAYFS